MMNRVDVKNTSRFPLELVRELVDFARDGRDHGHVALSLKNSKYCFRGRAYSHMPFISNRKRSKKFRYLVVAAVGSDTLFPLRNHSYRGLKTAPKYDVVDAIEAIVKLVAHELTHCQQFKQRVPCSEIHADESALRTLERFRQARLEERLPLLAAYDLAAAEAALSAPAEPPKPAIVLPPPTTQDAAEWVAEREEHIAHALPEHHELLRSLPARSVRAYAPTEFTWAPGKPWKITIYNYDLSREQRAKIRAAGGWRDINGDFHLDGTATCEVA